MMMMSRYDIPWKWIALTSLFLLALCIVQRRRHRLWETMRHVMAADAAVVPGAGRLESERRNPDPYHDPDNRVAAGLRPPPNLDPETFRQAQRFIDVGGHAYSRDFIEGFCYFGDRRQPAPVVTLRWLKEAETFVGTLDAHHLKPNFAYQVKLLGDPDDFDAFENIGYLGRWGLPGDETNVSDRDYARFPDKHRAESYLLFDFFVTDEHGSATKTLYADSSLHVLFHAVRQRRPRLRDSAPLTVTTRNPGGGVYANPDAVFGEETLFAEAESGSASGNRRPPIGRAFLASGSYRAHLALTEESFHWYGDGGQWATVLSTPVEFTVTHERQR